MQEIEFELTPDDYEAFNAAYMRWSPAIQRQRRSYGFLLAILVPLLTAIALVVAIHDLPILIAVGGAAVVGVPAWFLAPMVWDRAAMKNLHRMASERELGVPGSCRLGFGSEGMFESTPTTSISVRWGSLQRIDETDEHAFIFFGPTQAFVIPKRIGADDVATFLDAVRSGWQSTPAVRTSAST